MVQVVREAIGALQRAYYRFESFGDGSIIKPWPRKIQGAKYVSIGKDCFFGDGLVLVAADEHEGVRHHPQCTIGNECVFGSDAVIACTHSIVIEDGVLTSLRVFIGDSHHGYEDVKRPILHQPMAGAGPIRIGAGSFLGIGCAILAGTTLGKGCFVGANAVVKGTFPDHAVVAGVPARVVRRYDSVHRMWESVK